MPRSIAKIAQELKLYWKNYIFQSLLASLSVFTLLIVLHLQNVVVVASIGATAFIVFAMPDDITAKSRNVIAGQLVGFGCGALCALIPHAHFLSSALICSLAVGLSILIMVVTDTEHPPAAGTALGVALSGFSPTLLLSVLTSIIALSLLHRGLRPHLRNLV
jgi:CBS-domain-containing membrane protein